MFSTVGPADPPVSRVVLVHGLWMVGAAMRWYGARLREAGYAPEVFGYHSILGGPEAVEAALAARLRDGGPAHIVAHSLGGLLVLEALARHPGLAVGRIVGLGVPLCGSGAATSLARWPLVPLWLGRSGGLLRRGCVRWPQAVEVGVVAGSVPHGLGSLFARFDGAHDGTVAVAETRHPMLSGHVVVAASHSGLIFSRAAVRETLAFLRDGRFSGADDSAG
jgi:pimeloyl-ACP methyl ester carboxylesterase